MKVPVSHRSLKEYCIIFLFSSIYITPSFVFAQSKLNIGIGVDLLETYNVSFRYQGEQTQYALGVGTNSFNNEYEKILSISAGWYYHFHGVSTYTSKRPWYGRVVANYLRREYMNFFPNDKRNHLSIGLRVGREFNLSKRLAINSDIGFNFGGVDIDIPLGFSSGIWLFYRL
jgi:hypothetical protein